MSHLYIPRHGYNAGIKDVPQQPRYFGLLLYFLIYSILTFHCFTYVTDHSTTLLLLHLCHSSFSKSSVALPTSQFIFQPFRRFSYIAGSWLTSPGEPPKEILIVRYKDEDKISGHSTVEQATTVSLQKWRRGSTNAVNIIIEREGKHIFGLSWKCCLKLFLIDCISVMKFWGRGFLIYYYSTYSKRSRIRSYLDHKGCTRKNGWISQVKSVLKLHQIKLLLIPSNSQVNAVYLWNTTFSIWCPWVLIQELRRLLKFLITLTVIDGVICWNASRIAVFSSTRLRGRHITSPLK